MSYIGKYCCTQQVSSSLQHDVIVVSVFSGVDDTPPIECSELGIGTSVTVDDYQEKFVRLSVSLCGWIEMPISFHISHMKW